MRTNLLRSFPPSLLATSAVLLLAACGGERRSTAFEPGGALVRPAALHEAARPVPVQPNSASATSLAIHEALSAADEDALAFHQHVTVLADAFFEGRSADTRGGRVAAEYVAFHFKRLELDPAFDGESPYLQAFTVPGEVEVRRAEATITIHDSPRALEVEKDFNPLGFSGKGAAAGPMVFVGYSIEEGPEGYSSYKAGDDLAGKIAVLLRYEPVNEKGDSRWSRFDGWSRHAELMPKVAAAVSRGAVGVILLNPPGVSDPRSRVLETVKSTRFGRPIGVPAIMLSPDEAKALMRVAGTEGRDLMAYRRLADEGGHGAVPLNLGVSFRMDVDVDRARLDSNNVGGLLRGRGDLVGEYVIVGAHYDHLGYGHVGGANPNNIGQLHPGADDNASGTAGLLVLARRLAKRYADLPQGASARSVLFLAFGAEEMGLLGSEAFLRQTSIDSAKVAAMINMDMIGRMQNGEVEVSGMGTAEEFPAILGPIFDRSGLKVKPVQTGIGPSDHAAFHRAGAPVLALFSGLHRDYHQPSDLPHKVNVEGAVRILALAEEMTVALATRREALAFKQTSGMAGPGRGRARVRLGIMPGDYSGEEPGVLVGDVIENTSAAKAGIQKGDRIIRWGGEELADAGVMMRRLVDHKPGDTVELVVIRDGKEVTIPVTLMGRGGSE